MPNMSGCSESTDITYLILISNQTNEKKEKM